MTISYQIDRSGNFDPSTQQHGTVGDTVSFTVADPSSFPSIYVFSGSPFAADSTLFGTTSVRSADVSAIRSSAVDGRTYTLSVSAILVKEEETVIKNGTIKVGS